MPPLTPFRFTVINDLHYMEAACKPWLEGLIQKINATPNIDLVLVLGDLAETGSREELAAARDILNQLHAPYHTVPGNHDGPPDRPLGSAAAGLATYNELFPNRRNYSFTHKNWQFLALDTTNGSAYQQVPLTAEVRQFASHAAHSLDPQLPTILFTHFPLVPTIKYSLADGYDLLTILAPLNLRIVFSGHFHGLTENLAPPLLNHPPLKLLTNRTCSRARSLHDDSNLRGYFDCHANPDQSVDHTFIEYAGPAR